MSKNDRIKLHRTLSRLKSLARWCVDNTVVGARPRPRNMMTPIYSDVFDL